MSNKLSVVLAVHNEEKNLPRCLDSIKNLADEIIVVDGESTDNTVAIAKKYGAKVIKTTNKLNFHINKQMGMDQAKGELVLQLDADEVVDKELAQFIKKLKQADWVKEIYNLKFKIKNSGFSTRFALENDMGGENNSDKSRENDKSGGGNRPVAWWIKRKNLFLNTWLKKGGQYPDPVIRLYINGYARLPQKSVHEQIKVDGPVGWAKGHLLHYSNPIFADYLRKFNTYTSFTANQWYKEGKKPSLGFGLSCYLLKPLGTFFSLYLRHKGILDGKAGFVFALMSGLHFPFAYLKLWEIYEKERLKKDKG